MVVERTMRENKARKFFGIQNSNLERKLEKEKINKLEAGSRGSRAGRWRIGDRRWIGDEKWKKGGDGGREGRR